MTITALGTNPIAMGHIRAKYIALRKISLFCFFRSLVAATLLIAGSISYAKADDNFALAPSAHDKLVIFGPKGDQVAELSIPTISQAVTVGSTTFQISYGLDANNEVAAILSPSSSQPQPLHFTVLNKTIETDKQAVVTLTFPDSKHVIVDPGYIGTVTVNSRTLRHRDLSVTPPTPSVQPPAKPRPIPILASAPAPLPSQAVASNVQPSAPTSPLPSSDGPTANEQTGGNRPSTLAPPPLLGGPLSQPPLAIPRGASGVGLASGKKLFWAEPVTPPNGKPPVVGIDQMKLVAVQGPVTVTLPNGETKSGQDGMLVPSGTSIATQDHGSAAVFMGGVDSARVLPNSDIKVAQTLNGSSRKTNINVRIGTIFARVGHRPGETQDFEVHTPEGVAAARGTSFSITVTTAGGHEVTVCATQDGVVTLTDTSDGHVITVTPQSSGQISIGSVPGLPTDQLRKIFVAFMIDVQQFNTNMHAIEQAIANGTATPDEMTYYNANAGFDSNTQFYDVNARSMEVFDVNPDISSLLDRINPVNLSIPPARRSPNQQLEPFGTVPITPF